MLPKFAIFVNIDKRICQKKFRQYNKDMEKEFNVTGMVCAGCQQNIQKTVKKMKGVRKVNVNLVSATMTVDFDDRITPQAIIDKVTSIGYGATERTATDASVSN